MKMVSTGGGSLSSTASTSSTTTVTTMDEGSISTSGSSITSSKNDALHQAAAVDRIMAMRKTETSYCLQSFLHQQQSPSQKLVPLSDAWRGKVTQWAFNVVDHFGFSREVVTVSMGLFDRYLATRGNLCTGSLVLLTSLTTLHIAIKLHETKRIKSCVLADLSRGQFGTKHIDEMELEILGALSWKLHMPTPLAFVSEFLHFLPHSEVTSVERKEIYELSKYFTELAVCESSFVERQNSLIALATIYNAMDSIRFVRLTPEAKATFLNTIARVTMGQVYESPTFQATRDRLKTMYAKVSATDCNTPFGTSGYWGGNFAGGARVVVTPNGSPSSSSTSSSYYGSKHHQGNKPTTKFWYTPSPPTNSRSVAVKTALL